MCPQITASHLQPRRKQSGGSLSDLCQRGALGGPAGMLSIFTRIKSAMPRPEERSSQWPQNPETLASPDNEQTHDAKENRGKYSL